MKSLTAALLLTLLPILAEAQQPQQAQVQVNGNVQLRTARGEMAQLQNGRASFYVDFVDGLSEPWSRLRLVRVLDITIGGNYLVFRIPNHRFNQDGSFDVRSSDSGQPARVTSALNRSIKAVGNLVRVMKCTYEISNPDNTCDDRGVCTRMTPGASTADGHRRVQILREQWQEQRVVRITTQTGSATITGPVETKTQDTRVRALSRCQ